MNLIFFSVIFSGSVFVYGNLPEVRELAGGHNKLDDREKKESLIELASDKLCYYKDTNECYYILELGDFTEQVVAGKQYTASGVFSEESENFDFHGKLSILEVPWENSVEVTLIRGDPVTSS